MMNRRKFILAGTSGLVSAHATFGAIAQARKPRLGMLLAGPKSGIGPSGQWSPFVSALAELGWVEGRNIEFLSRFAEGALDRLPALAAELVALEPDVIWTHTRNGALAAAGATSTIPIVVGAAGEEALIELAGGLARPKGNVTGLTLVSDSQHAKVLELLKETLPAVTSIGVLVNPLSAGYGEYPAKLTNLLGPLRLDLIRAEAQVLGDLDGAFAAMATARAGAVLVTSDPNFNKPAFDRRIGELARRHRLPVAAMFDGAVREGGLLSLSTDYDVIRRRAAVYVDKILRGAKPGDLPIERPSVFQLVLNLKTAKELGIDLPASILLRANEVIE
jgi:putative tryptophan/tyrosine transport system substrate-binding protein